MALLDVVDLGEAQDFLGRKGALGADRLATYITAVSLRLDQVCGAVVQRDVPAEIHSGGEGYDRSIWLRHPAAAIGSVTEYRYTQPITVTPTTNGSQPTNGYYAAPHPPDPSLYSGELIRRVGGWDYSWWYGLGNIVVAYTAGRYVDTASVASHFKNAALIMLRNAVGSDEPSVQTMGQYQVPGGRFPTFAIPNYVREMLSQEWREIPGSA